MSYTEVCSTICARYPLSILAVMAIAHEVLSFKPMVREDVQYIMDYHILNEEATI